ncbi:hypothetical protein DFP73DRAFT_552702 [Morchella snyderi]|nr:hypothetical protein DFP73DRAFT_552702 [Morchella snyderi]
MKQPRSLIQPTLLPPTSVKLGRLVLSPYSPHQDYLDPPVPTAPEVETRSQSNFTSHLTSSSATKLRTRLTALVAASRSASASASVMLEAAQGTTYTLLNSGAWFRAACRFAEVREWFENAVMSAGTVYLVVGYHTLTDTKFVAQDEGAEINTGGVMISSGILGPGLRGVEGEGRIQKQKSWAGRKEWHESEERVWAVQYRKVVFKWFSSKRIEKGMLEKENRWKPCWTGMEAIRSHEEEEEKEADSESESGEDEDDDDDDEDVLELDLADEDELESTDRCVVGEEEFFF